MENKRKGVCKNYDGCTKADKEEIQEIDSTDEFICEECRHELYEWHEPVKKKRPIALISAIGVAIVAVIGIAIFLLCAPEPEIVYPETIDTSVDSTAMVVENITEKSAVEEDTTTAVKDSISAIAVEDTTVVMVEESQSVIEENVNAEPKKQIAPTNVATPKSPSSHNLGYASWNGGMRNGKPHGNGTMTFHQSRTIDVRDSRNRVAQSGEYVIGEWDNGHLVQGRWFKMMARKR